MKFGKDFSRMTVEYKLEVKLSSLLVEECETFGRMRGIHIEWESESCLDISVCNFCFVDVGV